MSMSPEERANYLEEDEVSPMTLLVSVLSAHKPHVLR